MSYYATPPAEQHPQYAQQSQYTEQSQVSQHQQQSSYIEYQHAPPQAQGQIQQQQQPQAQPGSRQTRHAHLAHLPVFSLTDAKGAAAAYEAAQFRDYCLGQVTPPPKLSAADQVGLVILKASGAEVVSMDKTVNGLLKFSAAVENISAAETAVGILTRWALPLEAGLPPLIVDVLEAMNTAMPFIGRGIYLKASRPVEIRVRGKYVANLNKIKSLTTAWTKSFNKKPVDDLALILNGRDIPLEMVLRVERVMAPVEFAPISIKFNKEWLVPS
jgi:hypothetical protein